jgi:hypothetical protein
MFKRVIGQAHLFGQISAKIIKNRVGILHKRMQRRFAFRMLQIKPDAFLITIKRLKKMAVFFSEKMWTNIATNISAIMRIFDFNHLSAQVREVLSAKRSRTILLDGDNA